MLSAGCPARLRLPSIQRGPESALQTGVGSWPGMVPHRRQTRHRPAWILRPMITPDLSSAH
jgi:hypothetical protein